MPHNAALRAPSSPDIVTIEQPVKLLDTQRENALIEVPRSVKSMPLAALVPDDETIHLPQQQLELVTSRVNKGEPSDIGSRSIVSFARIESRSIGLRGSTYRRVRVQIGDAPVRV
jgi:hypothetical protein